MARGSREGLSPRELRLKLLSERSGSDFNQLVNYLIYCWLSVQASGLTAIDKVRGNRCRG